MQPIPCSRVWLKRNFLRRIAEPEIESWCRRSVRKDLSITTSAKRNVMKTLIALLTVVSLVGVAAADDKKGGGGGGGGNAKVKTYDFSGDTIEGDLVKPEGSTVDARDFAKHSSLITIRTNFIAEIIKSAEDLP